MAHLASRDGDRGARDRVLRALIEVVRGGGREADLALAMLALGRWRDLDLIHQRWRRAFRGDTEEAVSMIRTAFAETVMRMDLGRSRNPEASLSLSTERQLHEWWQRERRRREATAECEGDIDRKPDPKSCDDASRGGFPSGMTSGSRLEALDRVARQAAGDDVDVVYSVDLLGHDLSDVAETLGISREAAKKRYQRAKGRMARALRDAGLAPCPRGTTDPATPRCEGDVRPGGAR